MSAIVAVVTAALISGLLAASVIVATHGRADLLDPQTEIRWLVRLLEHRPRAMAWTRRRLDRTTATGFMMTAAFATLVITAVLVGSLFEMFTRNALIARWDQSVANWGASNVGDDNRDVLVRITDLGSTPVVLLVTASISLVELIRRKWASAAFLVSVVAGQFLINNVLKWVVNRERPDIARLVGVSGASFPSGHTVAATATWSAVAIVLSRGASRNGRAFAAGCSAAVAGAVGTTRALLGAHWLTDVLAGLAVGWGWFTLVAVLFGGRRQRAAVPLEQAAHTALPPTPSHTGAPAARTATPDVSVAVARPEVERGGRVELRRPASILLRALALYVAVGTLAGLALSRVFDHTALVDGDESINEWFARQRTPTWNSITLVLSRIGNTESVIAVGIVAVIVMRLRWHRWNEAMVVVLGLGLEVVSFLALANIVDRSRPAVVQLDPAPPTSSFPSGHTAAATVLYVGMAWLIVVHVSHRVARVTVGMIGVAVPAAVAVGRVYRGMHHTTDVVAGALLGIACLVVAIRVAMPSTVASAQPPQPTLPAPQSSEVGASADRVFTRRRTAPPRSPHRPAGAAGAR